MHSIEEYLHSQEIEADLMQEVAVFRNQYSVNPEVRERIGAPSLPFYGKDTLEMALAAILQGENLLLSGGKATGKNVLCETLSWVFGRPSYDISFHVNTDSASLIGTDTFRDNEVTLRKGPVCLCAEAGGFGVLDEINMAKNDAISVLHATLDHRRRIDIPGYSRIPLPSFIAFASMRIPKAAIETSCSSVPSVKTGTALPFERLSTNSKAATRKRKS